MLAMTDFNLLSLDLYPDILITKISARCQLPVSLILFSEETQVDGRCALHLASLHPFKTPFVPIPGFLRRTQSAPLINLGIEQVRTSEVQFKFKESPF